MNVSHSQFTHTHPEESGVIGGGADAFISEFKHWRDVRGLSQSKLAPLMGYHRSYLSGLPKIMSTRGAESAL